MVAEEEVVKCGVPVCLNDSKVRLRRRWKLSIVCDSDDDETCTIQCRLRAPSFCSFTPAPSSVVTHLDVSWDCFVVLGCCNGGGVRWPLLSLVLVDKR